MALPIIRIPRFRTLRASLGLFAAAGFLSSLAHAAPQAIPWTPTELPGLQVWFKADAIPGEDRIDNLVSRWPDSRGAFHVASSGSFRPQFVPNGLAGKPIVRFDGWDDGLTRGSSDVLRNVSGGTMFTVRRHAGIPSVSRTVASVATGATSDKHRLGLSGNELGRPTGSARRLDGEPRIDAIGSTVVSTGFQVCGAVADFNAGILTQWIDGKAAGAASVSQGLTSNTNSRGIGVGSLASGGSVFAGDIAEVLVVKGAVSPADRERIEGYLAHRWQIASNLPAGHPYRLSPPTACPSGMGWFADLGGLNGRVRAFETLDGVLYAGGEFTGAVGGSATLNRVARWDGSQWMPVGNGFNGTVTTLKVFNGQLYAGGSFTAPGSGSGTIRRIAKWNGTSWVQVGATGLNDTVNALEVHDNQLHAGGRFTAPGGQAGDTVRLVARLDGSSWVQAGNAIAPDLGDFVLDLHSFDGKLYAAGDFTAGGPMNPQPIKGVGVLNGATWAQVGTAGFGPVATTLAAYGGEIHAGGIIQQTNGNVLGIRRFDQATQVWSSIMVTSGDLERSIDDLRSYEGDLYAAGKFESPLINNDDEVGVAKWNGSQWTHLGAGTSGGPVTVLAISGDRLRVGGGFSSVAAGLPAARVASWGCAGMAFCGLSIAPQTLEVFENSGTATLSLAVPEPACQWTASTSENWLSVSPTSGSGDATLTVTYTSNPGLNPRSATVTAAGRSMTLTQQGDTWEPNPYVQASNSWSIKAWFKADEIAPADRVGGRVTAWRDQVITAMIPCGSGLCPVTGQNTVTATGTPRPEYVPNVANGRPVVRFNGTNQALSRGASGLFRNLAGGTIFVVRNPVYGNTIRNVVVISTGNSTTAARASLDVNSLNTVRMSGRRLDSAAFQILEPTFSSVYPGFEIQCGEYLHASATWRLYRDGEQKASRNTQSAGTTSNTDSKRFVIGRGLASNNWFGGDIVEVLIYHRVLTTCQRQTVEGYLAHKWGLNSKLPSDHPYIWDPPLDSTVNCPLFLEGEEPDGPEDPSPLVLVPAQFATLAEAVEAAPDGAKILLAPGVHEGGVSISGKSLSIVSEAGPEQTVVDGGGQAGSVIRVLDGAQVILSGLTIRGGFGGTAVDLGDGVERLAGGGVFARDALVELVSCVVSDNLAGFGGGVAGVDASVVLDASEIRSNHTAHAGGGVWLRATESLVVFSEIHGNVAGGEGGGLSVDADSVVTLEATSICGNEPDGVAGKHEGDPLPCGCRADLDGDGVIGAGDLSGLMSGWGGPEADLDGDGMAGGADLALLLEAWGAVCGD